MAHGYTRLAYENHLRRAWEALLCAEEAADGLNEAEAVDILLDLKTAVLALQEASTLRSSGRFTPRSSSKRR